jgi:hypothetical protein
MRLGRVPLLLLFILAMNVLVHAQDKTDEFAQAQLRQQRIPGMSIAVVKNGQVVKAHGYGVADRQANTPATPETVYEIASVSKQFIATGIMLLVQDGKIRQDSHRSNAEGDVGAVSPESWNAVALRLRLVPGAGPKEVSVSTRAECRDSIRRWPAFTTIR